MSSKITQQWATFARLWYLVDAYKQPPGRVASQVSFLLQGKHKPIFHPLSDVGDHVIIINTGHIAIDEKTWYKRKHRHHTGYPGGFSETPIYKVHDKDKTKLMKKAIYGMLPKDLRRRTMMERLHLFPYEEFPDELKANVCDQLKPPFELPKTLPEYTQEEKDAFPRLWLQPDPWKKSQR
ncbi:large ribosomal subunit protein uL13m-like [Amphiura filiformis]|uniref:large ribosomal subunit protein uL13m-like n=1 Tax=Amphiura filiformis TaxID=82378 RepID=UPI003B21174B